MKSTTSAQDRLQDEQIARLWRRRPRSRFLRGSLLVLAVLLTFAWFVGDFDLGDTFSERRADNFARFLDGVRPYDLGSGPWDWGVVWDWARERMHSGGFEAALGTLAISVLAVVLAALAGALLSFPAARNFARPRAFAPAHGHDGLTTKLLWRSVFLVTRAVLILLRSLPEYMLAFLLLGILGTTAWPAVLALAIHNAGILGRLGAETVENSEMRSLMALRGLGARRQQIAAVGIWPAILPRFLLYFFYRWETCVREATVLGILGIASLGYLIDEAKVRFAYDDMLLFVGVGALIVLAGDLLSALARRIVRRAT